uniref:PA n=1 Tax=Old quarry swamp virus TaxID=2485876 RepID=A0A3G3BTG4_9VIRU|nr:PA [Old quarry swamp virus]
MDKYYRLVYQCNLYPDDIITNFGVLGKHWRNSNYRQRELSLRHDMVCIYLCNMEQKPFDHAVEAILTGVKRKRSLDVNSSNNKLFKGSDGGRTSPQPSTSGSMGSVPGKASTSTNRSSSSGGTIDLSVHELESQFRYILIEGMPQPELIQNHYAGLWGLNPPDSMWDIIDTVSKKFIEVKVSSNPKSNEVYDLKKLSIEGHTAYCQVNPRTGACRWIDHEGGLQGEEKVRNFILARCEALNSLDIMETELQEIDDLSSTVFNSPVFNSYMDQWLESWHVPDLEIREMEDMFLQDKRPCAIHPKQLLDHLSNLKEADRIEIVKWKAKIMPDGWLHDFLTEEDNDWEMVKNVVNEIFSAPLRFEIKEPVKEKDPDLLNVIRKSIEHWDSTNFMLHFPSEGPDHDYLKDLLGIEAKKRIHDEGDTTTKQPEYKTLENHRYDHYYDEIIRRLRRGSPYGGNAFSHLERDIFVDEHPVGRTASQACTAIIRKIGRCNGAFYCSRLANFYSRMGGSYLVHMEKKNKTSHGSTACFPIYANILCDDGVNRRLVSGIIIRGPQHARSPTDRTNFISIETMKDTKETRYLLAANKIRWVWSNDKFLIVARQNAIMKEDPSYATFAQNSLFVPSNLVGVMTVENPKIRRHTNMDELIRDLVDRHSEWFTERFVEGVIVSACSTTRDEGYFAMLRKIFMIILAWRRKEHGAHWDIEEMCEAVNECLIDNPISMHFHLTLLKILEIYSTRVDDTGNWV